MLLLTAHEVDAFHNEAGKSAPMFDCNKSFHNSIKTVTA